jgi:hypothetical protein
MWKSEFKYGSFDGNIRFKLDYQYLCIRPGPNQDKDNIPYWGKRGGREGEGRGRGERESGGGKEERWRGTTASNLITNIYASDPVLIRTGIIFQFTRKGGERGERGREGIGRRERERGSIHFKPITNIYASDLGQIRPRVISHKRRGREKREGGREGEEEIL